MRRKKDQEAADLSRVRQQEKKERQFVHGREVAAVATCFGTLFNKSASFHWYTPVHAAAHYIQPDLLVDPDLNKKVSSDSSVNSPEAQKLRRKQSHHLFDRHNTLARSDSAQNFLASSLHDIERHGESTPFQSPPSKKKDQTLLLSPTLEELKVRRDAKNYLDQCRAANVTPISKLLRTMAPLMNPDLKKQRNNMFAATAFKKDVDLHSRGLTVRSLTVLAKSVLTSFAADGLRRLDLSDNQALGAKSVSVLLETLEHGKAPKLQGLDLSSCNLRNGGALQAVSLLSPQANNKLSTIKLANNSLDDEFIKKFVVMYTSYVPKRRKADLSRLVFLDLQRNNIGERGGVLLGEAIREVGSALETLLLGWNHVGSKGAREILRGFVQVKPVTRISKLDLSFNSITDDMLEPDNALLAFLGGSRTLTLSSLDLSHNQLGPATAEDLVTSLSVRNRLSELKIGFNPLGLMGTARIVEAARQNALRTLFIENTIMKVPGKSSSTSLSANPEDNGNEEKNNKEKDHEDDEIDDDDLDHFDLSADVQYIWELAERVKRAKAVLLMMRARKKYPIIIEVEYPNQDREATNRLFQPMMSWLSGRAKRSHGDTTGGQGGKKKKEDEDQEDDANSNSNSVFHGRIAESESRSFWDSPHVIGAAFEEDFIKLNWHKVIKLSHSQEKKVHDALKSHFVLLKELFHYYAATKSGRAKGGFAITMNGMHKFVDEMKVWPKGKDWPRSKLDMMFVQAAVDRHKQDAHLVKGKRAKYLHKDLDDNFSLGSGTGLNTTSLTDIVRKRNQIAEVHAVRAKIEKEQREQRAKSSGGSRKKDRKIRKAAFHEVDKETAGKAKQAATKALAKATAASTITTMAQKKKSKKKNKKNAKDTKKEPTSQQKAAARAKSNALKNAKTDDGGGKSFGAQALRRSEFLGFVFRIAIERFLKSGEVQTAEDAINIMMEDYIIPNAFKDLGSLCDSKFLFDRNMFRDEKLYFVEIDQIIRDNFLALQAVYAKYSTEGANDNKNFAYKSTFQDGDIMNLEDFIAIINSMDRKDLIENCSRRAINIAFVFSQMLCSGDDEAASQASFCEFLEALCRLADMCVGKELKGLRIPLSVGFKQIVDSIVRGNQKDVDRFISGMVKDTAEQAKRVSKSKVSWSKEARSNSLDMTMAWLGRVKKKAKDSADGDEEAGVNKGQEKST